MESLKKISLLLILAILCSFPCIGCSSNQDSNTDDTTPVYVSYESRFDDVSYQECIYILNKNTHKFHYKDCYTIDLMNEENKVYCDDSRDSIITQRYTPCKKCNP